MKKFESILICTDLDGTLLKDDKTISKENKEAIEYFKKNGGMFTFVTGRMYFYARKSYDMVKPNVPVGCANGGALYDYENERYIWKTTIDKSVISILEYVDNNFPEMAFLINTPERVCFCKNNESTEKFRIDNGVPNIVYDYKQFNEDISKVIFADEEENNIKILIDMLNKHPGALNYDFVRSSDYLYEIVPKGYNKGTVLRKLADYLGVPMERTIAVGDFDNDVAMIKEAGIGIAVSNACDSAKECADIITVSNEEHAIAKIISDIETGIIKI